MDVDLFQQAGINPAQVNSPPVDLFQQAGINPASINPSQAASPLMSGVAGFNKGFESLPRTAEGLTAQGLDAAGLTNNATQNVNNYFQSRMAQQQLTASQNPLAGKIGSVAGNIGASVPMYAAAGARIPANAAAGAWTGYSQTDPSTPLAQKLINSALGGTTSAALSLIPFGLGKATEGLQTQEYAQNILKNLGGGKSLEDNGKSLAQDLKNAFKQKQDDAAELYNPILSKYGENQIYPLVNRGDVSQYLNLDPDITNNFSNLDITKLHNDFVDSPTFQNAHNLQSQLGTGIRAIQNAQAKSGGSVADNLTLQRYREAQNALQGDMSSFLNKVNPQAAIQYGQAAENYAQNVTPYLANARLSQIAHGTVTNPKSIASLFSTPEPEMQQIVEDMGPNAANKILYSQLGKSQDHLTPQNLISSFNGLDKNGLSSYVTADLANQIQTLAAKSTAKTNSQNILGAMIGSHFGGVPGAAAGAWLTPKLAQLVNSPLATALLKGVGRGASVLPSTVTPNVMPQINNMSTGYFNSQGGQ